MVTGTVLSGIVGLESVVTGTLKSMVLSGTVLSGIVDVPLSSDIELSIIQWSLLLRVF